MWEQERLGARPIHTWNDAVVRYLGETKHKASQASDIFHLRWLDQHLNGIELQAIKRGLLDKISTAKQAEGVDAHLSSEHLAQWVDRRPAVMAENLPEIGTFFTTAKEKGLSISA